MLHELKCSQQHNKKYTNESIMKSVRLVSYLLKNNAKDYYQSTMFICVSM